MSSFEDATNAMFSMNNKTVNEMRDDVLSKTKAAYVSRGVRGDMKSILAATADLLSAASAEVIGFDPDGGPAPKTSTENTVILTFVSLVGIALSAISTVDVVWGKKESFKFAFESLTIANRTLAEFYVNTENGPFEHSDDMFFYALRSNDIAVAISQELEEKS